MFDKITYGNSPMVNIFHFPILLKNRRIAPTLYISENIAIHKLTQKQKASFFGIAGFDFGWGAKYDAKFGHIIPSQIYPAKIKGRYNYQHVMNIGILDGTYDILASEYSLVITSEATELGITVERINSTFKLLRPTSTGGYLGFKDNDTDVYFHHSFPLPIHGPFDYLHLQASDRSELVKLYESLVSLKDDNKLRGALFHYSRALENLPPNRPDHLDIRFILLMIVLDLLYIPNGLSKGKKMASRVSHVLSSKGVSHRDVCKLYNIRNEVIHDGKSDSLQPDDFVLLTDIVWKSLRLYLANNAVFDEDALSAIPIRECEREIIDNDVKTGSALKMTIPNVNGSILFAGGYKLVNMGT